MIAGSPDTLTRRPATEEDLPALADLMARAIDSLQHGCLTDAHIAASHEIMGLDTRLIADRTNFIVEEDGVLAGCLGRSRRATLYGGDHSTSLRNTALLNPTLDAARVRAMYTHPSFARRGVGRLILSLCEQASMSEDFSRTQLMATLSGEPLYLSHGYIELERTTAGPIGGVTLPLILKEKSLTP